MSTPPLPAAPSPRRDRPVNRWHRNAGVAAAGMLVYLLATGIPLQFSAELDLGQDFVGADWVLDWYGLTAPDQVTRSGNAVQVGQQLYLDEQPIATMSELVGAVSLADFTLVAGKHDLLVTHRQASHTAEKTLMPNAIERIGRWQNTPYLDTAAGLLAGDELLINWHDATTPAGEIEWARVSRLTDPAAASYRARFRARMLTTERWLQDLHSGRFFGSLGILIVDVASLLLLILAATGLLLWWRFRNS